MIDNEGVLKIGDFGLSADWPAPECFDAEGDRRYIGPEVLNGKSDKPSDIYSLGLIIFEMGCNIQLPDNGLIWRNIRDGNHSDMPPMTLSEALIAQQDVGGFASETQQAELGELGEPR